MATKRLYHSREGLEEDELADMLSAISKIQTAMVDLKRKRERARDFSKETKIVDEESKELSNIVEAFVLRPKPTPTPVDFDIKLDVEARLLSKELLNHARAGLMHPRLAKTEGFAASLEEMGAKLGKILKIDGTEPSKIVEPDEEDLKREDPNCVYSVSEHADILLLQKAKSPDLQSSNLRLHHSLRT
jgi:hypothetical protein